MTNYNIKYSFNLTLIALCFSFSSCNVVVLDEEGDKYIKKLMYSNRCWEIIVNESHVANTKNPTDYYYLGVYVRGCNGILNISEVEKNDSIIQAIADTVVKHALDLNKFSKLKISCSSDSKDSYAKIFVFDIKSSPPELIETYTASKLGF